MGNPDAAAPPSIDAGPVTLGACNAPSNLPQDPLTRTGRTALMVDRGVIHMLDIEQDPATGVIYLIGSGGLFSVQGNDNSYRQLGSVNPRIRGTGGGGGGGGRGASYHKVKVLGQGMVAVSNRDQGVAFVNASDPSNMVSTTSLVIPNAAGMNVSGNYLFISTHSSEIITVDISSPSSPQQVASFTLPAGNPWDLVISGNRAYVADNTLGIIVVDITNPTSLSVIGMVSAAGAVQDLSIADGHLFAATGVSGIEIFSISNPDAPQSVSRIEYGSSIVSVSASDGYAWGATHEDIVVANVSNPSAPMPIGTQYTDSWAMAVWSNGATGLLANWTNFEAHTVNTQASAPETDPSLSNVYFYEGSTTVEVRVFNRGNSDLIISGANIDDTRFTLELDRNVIPPGQSATFTVSFEDDGNPVNTNLCIASNDPDEPIQNVSLTTSNTGSDISVGQDAIDFSLPNLEGTQNYRLSEQLGKPVVLVYFATW